MGVDGKKHSSIPPLPAPTETESTIESITPTATELATDVSKPIETKSSYSLPEDGTPVTIKTRGHKHQKSQTSLLIEYFEGGKSAGGASDQRKPSVRVRLTPSKSSRKSGSERDHIQITETKTRKASLTRRRTTSPSGAARLEAETISTLSGDPEDAKSLSSYASATEESNVSRNPIDIEIDRTGNIRRRRPASPLIPTADSNAAAYQNPAMSDISAIPTDSFLDGSGGTTSLRMSDVNTKRSKSPSRARDVIGGAAAGLAAGAAVEKLRSKKRESRDDDIVVSKSRDKDQSERKKSSKSRSSSVSEKDRHSERSKTPRKRSSGGHAQDSAVSAADTSVLSSNLTASHRSYDQHSVRSGTSKASSINNPKLLETVEDAIRRLILPELNALKREQSKHKSRRDSTTSTATTASRDDYASDRRRSSATEKHPETPRESLKKERRDREARHDFDYSPSQSGASHLSVDETSRDIERTPKRSSDRLPAAAVGAAAGAVAAAAMHEPSTSDDKRTRRRRRAELRSRTSEHLPQEEYEDSELSVPDPPMPLMSEVGTAVSGMTRTSILSADTDRPHSASEELTPVQEVPRGVLSESGTPTPTRTPISLQHGLGTQHANISHGDLKALPRRGTGTFEDEEFEAGSYDRKGPHSVHHEYEEDEYEQSQNSPGYIQAGGYDYYNTQDVPPPLKYVPYQPERRGLSPIPSVSGYTEGGSEAPNRDSRVTHTSGSMSSPEKSGHDDALNSPTSVRSNVRSREFADDDRSVRSSGMDYGNVGYNDGSEVSQAESGHAVRAVGANPQIVHPPIAIESLESNVASLVDGSMLDGSVLTNESGGYGQNAGYSPRHSMVTLEEERSLGHASPSRRSVDSRHTQQSRQSQRGFVEERNDTPVSSSQRSREFAEEYDVDEYGRKVPRSKYRQSPTASEAAITVPALTAAAAAIKAAQGRGKGPAADVTMDEFEPAGVQRNKSFKERAMNGAGPLNPATRNAGLALDEYDQPKMDFRAIPDFHDPMHMGNWDDGESVDGDGQQAAGHEWNGDVTPRQQTPVTREMEQQGHHEAIENHSVHEKGSSHGIGLPEVAAAAAIGTIAGMASSGNHSRQSSQEQVEEWHRTSDDRKRDTLVTNPYEGTSPIVNLPGLNDALMSGSQGYNNADYGNEYAARSPIGHNPDEGYISQGPNKTPDIQAGKGKGVDFQPQQAQIDDPFFVTKHSRHMSGMSHGMDSSFYDAATGAGIDRIESKDIIALMQHLMVRDAQRSARDTEILVTLVRAAAEMRNSFEDIKKMLADTEDVIITEVKENTDKTVQRAINGPRPFPGSGARSLQGGSQSGTMTVDDLPAKRRNIFRRALKGLSGKGVNDLGRIEDMLNQLLTEVDVLKAQTGPGTMSASNHGEQSYDNLQPEGAYEQDRGYEPEGNAGTSTASHASQSGHLSIPQSRGASAKLGYDRKFSDHRISTVPEDNEDDYDYQATNAHGQQSNPDMLMTPVVDVQRGGSVPLGTPPQTAAAAQASVSNDNTPRTDKGKKHKSTSSTGWFGIPKISRWSETTTSSVAQAFRRSKKNDDDGNFQSPPSRSGSDLAHYDDEYGRTDPYGEDKLHSGFSQQDFAHEEDARSGHRSPAVEDLQAPPPIPGVAHYRMTPEDPKYKAHRDSLNLQHPQPRPGQTELFKATLESQAQEFDSPMSPRSAEWAGSATSLHRLPRNANRDSYGSAADQGGHQQYWTSSPAAGNIMTTAGPPRPPKEPLDRSGSPAGLARATPPKSNRISKLQKGSPLPYHSVESGYGTMTHGAPSASYVSHAHTQSQDSQQSPRLENRNLSGALGVPTRRPSGPRAMTPKSVGSAGSEDADAERRRKRDTFGTIASQETDTF